jgi:membrane protease YdiL (CAAX protease family)
MSLGPRSGWKRSPAPLLVELAVFFAAFELCYRVLPHHGWWGHSVLRPEARSVYLVETPAMLAACAAAFLLIYPALRVWRGGWGPRAFGLRPDDWGRALRFAAVLLGLDLTISSLGFLVVPGLPDQLWAAYGRPSGLQLAALLLFVVPIGAAIGEELVYRGYVQGGLQGCHRAWGPVTAALVFAGLHAFQGLVPLLLFHVPGALLVAAAYRRTGNIVVFILFHLAFDLIVFTALWVMAGEASAAAWLPAALLAAGLGVVLILRRTLLALVRELLDVLLGLRVGWRRGVLWALAVGALFAGASRLPWATLGGGVDPDPTWVPLAVAAGGLVVLAALSVSERRRGRAR